MATSAKTRVEDRSVPTDEQLIDIVGIEPKVSFPLQLKDRLTGLFTIASGKIRWLTQLPPVRWAVRMVRTAIGGGRKFIGGYRRRSLIAAGLMLALTPEGRRAVDKVVRFTGRALVKVTSFLARPLGWLLRKCRAERAGNWVSAVPDTLHFKVAVAYDRMKGWLHDKLPLDKDYVQVVGYGGAALFATTTIGRLVPTRWLNSFAGRWAIRALGGIATVLCLSPLKDRLDEWTRKIEAKTEARKVHKAAETIVEAAMKEEPAPVVAEPMADVITDAEVEEAKAVVEDIIERQALTSRVDAQRIVVERTMALLESPRNYSNYEEMGDDLLRVIVAPLAAAYPKPVVEIAVADYVGHTCPWEAADDETRSTSELLHIQLAASLELGMDSVEGSEDMEPATHGIIAEDPDPLTLEKVVADVEDLITSGKFPAMATAGPTPAKSMPQRSNNGSKHRRRRSR